MRSMGYNSLGKTNKTQIPCWRNGEKVVIPDVQQRFSPEVIGQRYVEFYKEMISLDECI